VEITIVNISLEKPLTIAHPIAEYVEMVTVIILKVVARVKPIVVHVLQQNHVAMVFVMVLKIVWHVRRIVQDHVLNWKCVVMDNVMDLKTVRHVQMIVVHVLLKNIVETIFVIMGKPVIHVEQIVLHVQTLVEIASVIQQVKRVRLVQPIVVTVLEFVEMERVI
jgi:hypothetical protein